MPEKFSFDTDPFFLMRILNKKMRADFDEILAEHGLTTQQGRIVFFVHRSNNFCHKEVRQVDIEKEFGLSKSTVSGLIDRMENSGFVKRNPSGKSFTIVLTDKSEKVIDFIHENMMIYEEQILKDIPKEDVDKMLANLKKMLTNLKKYKEEKDVTQN